MDRSELKKLSITIGIFIVFFIFLSYLLMGFETTAQASSIKNFYDALWYGVVTLTTVGYGDMYPVSNGGKIIGFIFVLASLGVLGYLINRIGTVFADIRRNKFLGLNGCNFKRHFIIVGWNDLNKAVLRELVNAGKNVALVTDKMEDIEKVKELYTKKQLYVLYAEPDNIELIQKTNINEAAGVLINIDDDTSNLVLAINLRKIAPNPFFVTVSDNKELFSTFKNAGIDVIIDSQDFASQIISSYIYEEKVALFAEDLLSAAVKEDDTDVVEFRVKSHFHGIGASYFDVFKYLKNNFNSILIGLSRYENGKDVLYKNYAGNDLTIQENDKLIMIITSMHIDKLEKEFRTEEGGY